MNTKKIRKIILPVLVLLIVAVACLVFTVREKTNTAGTSLNKQKSETQTAEESWEEDTPEDICETGAIKADFAVTYESYADVVEASELVVTGEVKDIYSYLENGRIISHYELKVAESSDEDVKAGDSITIYSIGGKMKYSEYVDACRSDMLEMMSEEELNESVEERRDSYVEYFWEDVPNLNIGDEVALCLGTSDEIGEADYYIIGTSYYGQFIWDEDENSVYKLNVEVLNSDKRKFTKKNKLTIKEFRKKANLAEGAIK